jgi:hypothetical protein
MYSDDDIDSAVKAGIMTNQLATAFRDHVAHQRSTPIVDEEQFRLITGFNDIFVVIACLLLLVSVSWIGGSVSLFLGALLQVITAWGLAEYFIRKRRMSLPSIVLLLAFVGGVFVAGLAFIANVDLNDDLLTGIVSVAAAFAAWLHWQRFRVPITVAAGTATLVAAVMLLLFGWIPGIRSLMLPLIFFAGVMVFLLAMRWDSSDTQRQTRRSDVAFWLHLLAAPLLVHPIFSILISSKAEISLWGAASVAVLYFGIALISLSIDRRALMVSALAYVLYAVNSIFEQYGVVSLGFAFTAFCIGSGLLLLSAFWHACRQAVIVHYPASIQKRLPSLR